MPNFYEKAVPSSCGQMIHQLAEQGDPEAQCSMGIRYDLGDGIERDPIKAAEWFYQDISGGTCCG